MLRSLPAAWVGSPCRDIVHGLVKALFSTLDADVVVACLDPPWGEATVQDICARSEISRDGVADRVLELLAPMRKMAESVTVHKLRDRGGDRFLRVTTVPIAYEDGWGAVAACASRRDFPSEYELLHLTTGATQAAIALRFNSVQRQLEFLREAGVQLAKSLDYQATLQRLTEIAIPFLGDQCAVYVMRDDGSMCLKAAAHINPATAEILRRIMDQYPAPVKERHSISEVQRTGVSQLYPELPPSVLRDFAQDVTHLEHMRVRSPRSAMLVPVPLGGQILGVLEFVDT